MKKIVAILAVLMIMLAASAYAEVVVTAVVPSKTVTDVTQVEDKTSVVQIMEDTAETQAVLTELIQFAQNNPEAPIVEAFSEEVRTEIITALPPTVVPENLVMNEFISIKAATENTDVTPTEATFAFVTKYSQEQSILALVGIIKDGKTEWHVLEASANADGRVTVHFTTEVLQKMASASNVTLAILSAPTAS